MKRSAVFAILLIISATLPAAEPPATKRVPVTDTYHGVAVQDDYQWLEDWDDPHVRKWSEVQNTYARSILDELPDAAAIRRRVTEIMAAESVRHSDIAVRHGRLFAIKREPRKQQPLLVAMPWPADLKSARVLVDPNAIDPKGGTSIDWYVPSHSGKLVAVSLSKGGTESGDVHVFETASGRQVYESIRRVNGGTAGGDVAWLPDDSGFFYTRYPRDNERPAEDLDFFQQVYFHALGTQTKSDRYELGKDFPRIAEIQLDMDSKSGLLLVTVQDGDGGEFAHYLRATDGTWRQFSRFGDRIVQAAFGPKDDLLIVSRRDAPRGKILRMLIATLSINDAELIIPEGEDSIVTDFWGKPTVLPTDTRLYVTYQLGGPSEIRAFDFEGNRQRGPAQPNVSSAGNLTQLKGDEILFDSESFIEPDAYYHFDPHAGTTAKTVLGTDSTVDFSDALVARELATSKDGTKVPVNIIMPKNTKLDGNNPCLVNGYGGYGVCIEPRYQATRRLLLDQGMIYVVANLRGGGEYGEVWHRQGNLTNKQNVFDDFAAVLAHLVESGYTSPSKLGIIGGSNGGLLMGATMTQHPEMMRCVISYVGIYDMLRVELSPNGKFNITEFGTVKDPNHFRALHAYSPFHNVEDGTKYPATLFLTGANDPRVDPMQSRKMTARLQAATASAAPILLRTSANSGHGGDTALSERIEQTVDTYAFLFHQLGMTFREGGKGR